MHFLELETQEVFHRAGCLIGNKCVCVQISALLLGLKSTDNSFPRRKEVLEVDNIFLAEDLENIF